MLSRFLEVSAAALASLTHPGQGLELEDLLVPALMPTGKKPEQKLATDRAVP